MKTLTIATRGSKLALWQAEHVKERIETFHSGEVSVRLEIVKTTGDKIQDVPLAQVGGKGLFVKEIEEAILNGRADLAVHSMKDVPTELPDPLHIGVVTEREDCVDLLLSTKYSGLDALPDKAIVGTSSLRRQCQLLSLRPELDIRMLRGNLDTRLGKLHDGLYDAIVVAAAGMRRLGLSAPYVTPLVPPDFLPAVAQGALGLEFSTERRDLADLLAFLDHRPTHDCIRAERAFLHGLDGGCQVPIACWARFDLSGEMRLDGLVGSVDGRRIIRKSGAGNDPESLGRVLAASILEDGGLQILREVYGLDSARS
ncbi:MAG: hydroxymethylbilane synthase [Deltaproteobacteria bacterium]|nr:hydroxymethylbilane synthase [Deltaproteobacteria bacterium]